MRSTVTIADVPGGVAAPETSSEPTRAFVAFAGGGAKGLVHVGALRALQARRVDVIGYAGTSAGAIVAALAAAGVSADEMINPGSDVSIIDELTIYDPSITKLTDLFGPGGWSAIRAFRTLTDRATAAQLPPVLSWGLTLLTGCAILALTAFAGVLGGCRGALEAMLVWALSLCAIAAALLYLAGGLARVRTFRNAIDKLLTARLFGPGSVRTVVMADFDGDQRPLLKIVASDITQRRLQLFSCDSLGSTAVADAVAASICLPLIFAPWRIGAARFVDGGVVSNFPAWPFDEERSLNGEAVTIGFQIGVPLGPDGKPSDAPKPAPWPVAVLQTALFGSSQLSTRAVGRAELITLRPKLKLLEFDITGAAARRELADMTQAATSEIDRRLFRYPKVYREACTVVREEVESVLSQAPAGVLRDASARGRVRCGVAMPPPDYRHSLLTRFGVGYEDDPDSDLLLPIAASLAGEAWREKLVIFELDPFRRRVELDRPQDVALRRRLPSDLAWSLRVPMLTIAGEPFLVVMVDGSTFLQDAPETVELIDALADRIADVFGPVVSQFEETASHGQHS